MEEKVEAVPLLAVPPAQSAARDEYHARIFQSVVREEGRGSNGITLVEELPASDPRAQLSECLAAVKS